MDGQLSWQSPRRIQHMPATLRVESKLGSHMSYSGMSFGFFMAEAMSQCLVCSSALSRASFRKPLDGIASRQKSYLADRWLGVVD